MIKVITNPDDQRPCFDCGRIIEWNEKKGDWFHLDENRGCFMDNRNEVVSNSERTNDTCGGE